MRTSVSIFSILLCVLVSACSPSQIKPPATSTRPAVGLAAPPGTAYLPRFESSPCWGTIPSGVSAACGYVIVPQNRGKPFDEKNLVRLAVVVLRNENINYTQPPTFLLGGGPGQDLIGMYEGLLQSYQSLKEDGFPVEQYSGHLQDMQQFMAVMDLSIADLQKREFVYFDQRGAGYSQPSLKCQGESWHDCRERLISAGVDLGAYSTLENAADVNDIRLALGYDQINLQGGSYGTRLALEVMRANPEIVRAAVLDGVAPPQVDWATEMVRRYDDALQVLFDHCQADPACNRAYPDLDTEFYDLVERLNDRPIDLKVGNDLLTQNGDDFRNAVWNALFDANKIRFLPAMIHQTSDGHPEIWERMLTPNTTAGAGESMAWGMHYAVECPERWAFETPQDLVDASEGLPSAIRESVTHDFAATFWACEEWDLPSAPAIVHEPVQSNIPTLLLSGEFDPGTQPIFAELAARTLSRHYNYVFPYLGHTDGFTNSCHASVVSAFLDHPDRAPEASCIGQMDKPVFVIP